MLAVVKTLQVDLVEMNKPDEWIIYNEVAFWDFNALCSTTYNAIPMKWITKGLDLNAFGLELISFGSKDHSIKAVYQDLLTKVGTPVTRKVFSCIIDSVKSRASGW
jgi:hypothetical protein